MEATSHETGRSSQHRSSVFLPRNRYSGIRSRNSTTSRKKTKTSRRRKKKKKAEPEKSAKQQEEEKDSKPEAKTAQEQGKPERNEHAAGGRIPADRYKANFGREHTFRVSQKRLRNHRFQYGGYWFGFGNRVAEQLALHARRLCRRDQRSVLPVQSDLSRREPYAQRHALAPTTFNQTRGPFSPARFFASKERQHNRLEPS
jgi:hypothetical protein